jgi:transcriptional regulator with XRE-family HTH domain
MNRGSQALSRDFASARGRQHELAVKTGISQSWLSRIAAGTALPNRPQSLAIEKETGIAPAWYDEPALVEAAEAAGQ